MSEEVTLQTEFSHNSSFFEEIIGRSEVPGLSTAEIQKEFSKERILIIGAGGTIGSAISRKLINSGLKEVYFLDRDESTLHNLALSLSNEAASHSEKCIVADIKDLQSVSQAISNVAPTTVLHAAALKHLVMLERFPREGFITNVIGTLNVLDASHQQGVKNLINISTDKAANPSSILGMTKKITEVLVEEYSKTNFDVAASVRFGNVFASRGSVIETFIHQLKNGLPITITDENVARFFMSHNEAANLVLSAATIREKGTFVQNMGEEIKISEVVFSLARWLNVKPRITYVGLQNGEKLHEELFDGPVAATKFPDIVRLKDTINHSISKKMREATKLPNEQIETFLRETLTGIYA
jgi:FlaA1/EpsC-like NDP-sugar epimerase